MSFKVLIFLKLNFVFKTIYMFLKTIKIVDKDQFNLNNL